MLMGFRFRKSVKLMQGVRLNFSKSGISTSVGRPGATVNFSKRGTRTTVGIPGTGLSYSKSSSRRSSNNAARYYAPSNTPKPFSEPGFGFFSIVLILLALIVAISSFGAIEKDGNLAIGLGSVVFIGLLIFRVMNKKAKYRAAITAQLVKEAEEQEALEAEQAKEYSTRIALIQERFNQNLLSSDGRDMYTQRATERSITLNDLDLHLERARVKHERINTILTKYGDEVGNKILKEEFWIGMTKEQVIDSKGRQPDKIEVEALKTKTKETLIYGNKTSGDVFVIENGTVARFKDR
ncbi:DUF4236 domain-containing protein [Pontibacter sp. H249]|uniref:DUF4236 domain-containing protein n=1 Tax=Pontibacter sp. H249 TaxID=3133420 RepID=UPI0030C53F67